MFMNIEKTLNRSQRQEGTEPQIEISDITPEDRDSIREYLEFEVEHKFTIISEEYQDDISGYLDGFADFRQEQISNGGLKTAIARNQSGELIAVAEVVLKDGIKGKRLHPNEAHSAGTLVRPDQRSGGIGRQMAEKQELIARQAGKEFMVCHISSKNPASLRLRINRGYQLEGIVSSEEVDYEETYYKFRKDLKQEAQDSKMQDYITSVEDGSLNVVDVIDQDTPEQILIDPDDEILAKEALDEDYQGVFFIRPEDFDKQNIISKNLIVFEKK